jgi:hypothetical protein
MLNDMKHINKMLTIYELYESSTLYFPIDPNQIKGFKNFNTSYTEKYPNTVFDLLPLLLSNIAYPYM